MAVITTPNVKMSLSRNPWHIREYTAQELMDLASNFFDEIKAYGITGNKKVMEYYENNKRSVEKIMKYDIIDLQHRLPAFLLKIPYEVLNRINRKKLTKNDAQLTKSISYKDYMITDTPDKSLDLFYYLYKK